MKSIWCDVKNIQSYYSDEIAVDNLHGYIIYKAHLNEVHKIEILSYILWHQSNTTRS